MSDAVPLDQWADVLEAIATESTFFNRVVVLAETDSTQEACRLLGSEAGLVVAAGRQLSGRGRQGRTWLDTRDQGVAMSFVLRDPGGVLPLAAPVATALALESITNIPMALKWPNDVLVGSQAGVLSGRKLAGILIERTEGVSIVGIGINVGQEQWPEALSQRAASLRQLGCEVERIRVCQLLLQELDHRLNDPLLKLRDHWADRDALRGQQVTVTAGKQKHEGIVAATDPTGTLRLVSDGQVLELDSATATIVPL